MFRSGRGVAYHEPASVKYLNVTSSCFRLSAVCSTVTDIWIVHSSWHRSNSALRFSVRRAVSRWRSSTRSWWKRSRHRNGVRLNPRKLRPWTWACTRSPSPPHPPLLFNTDGRHAETERDAAVLFQRCIFIISLFPYPETISFETSSCWRFAPLRDYSTFCYEWSCLIVVSVESNALCTVMLYGVWTVCL